MSDNVVVVLCDTFPTLEPNATSNMLRRKFTSQQVAKLNWIHNRELEYKQFFPIEYMDDPLFVMHHIVTFGYGLQFASKRLKSDKSFVLEVVKQKPQQWCHASEALKNDKQILLEACKHCERVLERTTGAIRNDREIVLESVKHFGGDLMFASTELRNDREIVMAAVKSDGLALQYASIPLRNDSELIMESKQGEYYESLGELMNDKSFVLEEIKRNPNAFKFVDMELMRDREVVFEAITRNGYLIHHVPHEFYDDREVVLEAAKTFGNALNMAPQFLNDKQMVMTAIKSSDGLIFSHASDALKNDREVALEALKYTAHAYMQASDALKNDREFLFQAAVLRPNILMQAPPPLKALMDDGQFILEVMKQSGNNHVLRCTRRLTRDRAFMMQAIGVNGTALVFASDELLQDEELVLEAVKQHGFVLEYSDELYWERLHHLGLYLH